MTKKIEVRCYSCGETLDFEDSSCAKCSAMQVRLCECGKTVSTHTDRCPSCGLELDLLEYAPSRRWMVVVAILLALAGIGFGIYRLLPGDPERDRRRAFVDAADDYNAGNYAEAHLKFRRFVETYDRDPRALYMLGISLHRLNRQEEGIVFAREALEIDPSIEEAAVYLASYEYERGNYDAARELCTDVLDRNPEYPGAHEVLGKVLSRPGFLNLPEAIRHLEFAAKNQPPGRDTDPEVLVLLGELHLARERSNLRSESTEVYSREWIQRARDSATKLQGTMDPADLQFFLARCDYALGNFGKASVELQKAVNAGDRTPEQRLLEARLQWQLHNRAEALKVLDDITADSSDPGVLLQIISFYQEQGLEDRAAETLAFAKKSHPNEVTIGLEVARDLASRGEFAEAERVLEPLYSENRDDERIVVALAEALWNQPDREQVGEQLLEEFATREGPTSYAMIRWIDRLLDIDPDAPEAEARLNRAASLFAQSKAARSVNESYPVYMNFLQGKLYFHQQLFFDAREILRTVTSRAPDRVSPHRLLALIHQALGEPEYEAMELSAVMQLKGESPGLLVERARAWFRDGNLTRAAADCQTVLARTPSNADAAVLLATIRLAGNPSDVEGAIQCLRPAMKGPDTPLAIRIAMARALMARKDVSGAERELSTAWALPKSDEEWVALVSARADLEDVRADSRFSPGARKVWTDHLAIHPNSELSTISFARVLLLQGAFKEAGEWLARAILADPENVPARRLQFELEFAGGTRESVDVESARALVKQVQELAPDSADDLYLRGKLALFEDRDEEAVGLLTRASAKAPRDGMMSYYTGLALERCGSLDRAREAYARAMDLEPNLLSARLQLANLAFERSETYVDEGNLAEATAELQFTIRNSPNHMPARARLTEVFFRAGLSGDQGALDKARQECEWLIARYTEPTQAELEGVVAPAWMLIAQICGVQGDLREVIRACDQYLSIFPGDTGTLLRKATTLLETGESEAALELLKPLHLEQPEHPRVLLALAEAYQVAGRAEEALATVQDAVSRQPENASVWYILGRVLQQAGQTAEAEAKFQEALRLDPDLLAAADAITDLLIETGRFDDLIASLTELLARTRFHSEIRYLLALANLARSEQSPRGLHLLETALKDGFESQSHRLWCTLVLLRVQTRSGNLADARETGTAFAEWSRGNPEIQPGWPLAGPAAEAHFLAGLAQHVGKYRLNAEFHYRQAMKLAPNWALPLVNLAELLRGEATGAEEALSLARRATDLKPDLADAWDTLGSVYTDQGFPRKAAAAFDRAVELMKSQDPDARESSLAPTTRRKLAETLTRKAQAELDLGEPADARESLRLAKQTDPTIEEDQTFQATLSRLR